MSLSLSLSPPSILLSWEKKKKKVYNSSAFFVSRVGVKKNFNPNRNI